MLLVSLEILTHLNHLWYRQRLTVEFLNSLNPHHSRLICLNKSRHILLNINRLQPLQASHGNNHLSHNLHQLLLQLLNPKNHGKHIIHLLLPVTLHICLYSLNSYRSLLLHTLLLVKAANHFKQQDQHHSKMSLYSPTGYSDHINYLIQLFSHFT